MTRWPTAWTPMAPPPFFGGFAISEDDWRCSKCRSLRRNFHARQCPHPRHGSTRCNTLTWTPTGENKFDVHDEEGWTLLPNKKVLTVDTYVFRVRSCRHELGNLQPQFGQVVQRWQYHCAALGLRRSVRRQDNAFFEVGPGVLRPDGTVFYTGANGCGAAHIAIYHSDTGLWTAGRIFRTL